MPRRALAPALALFGSAVAVAGCAPQRAMLVRVDWTGDAGAPCAAEVDGRRIAMRNFEAFARRWRGREAHLSGDVDTPYRCIGGVIYDLQKAGFRRIGFLSEPAPASPPGR